MRVLGYVRVSTSEQASKGAGLEAQRRAILAECLRRGWHLVETLEDVARLRITVFRDYPYLYDGNAKYEAEYLAVYAKSPRSIFVLALDGEELFDFHVDPLALVERLDRVGA